mmetsp:Transcript_11359/g.26961  ORF Transcript_11359/g.26961 Transcript_11359/m.26961 type:complete len:391 (-) Transcript_11359:138-1310(-)
MEKLLREELGRGLPPDALQHLQGSPAASGSREQLDQILSKIPGLEGMSKEEAMGHASRLWEFMDELAEDPEAYQEFLRKQAAAAGVDLDRAPSRPRRRAPHCPVAIVNTRFMRAPSARPPLAKGSAVTVAAEPAPMVHAIVAVWEDAGGDVPAPSSSAGPLGPEPGPDLDWASVQVPLKMRTDPFEQRAAQGKSAVVYEVACHRDAAVLATSDGPTSEALRPVLVELIFRWLEARYGILLSRNGRQMRVLESEGGGTDDSGGAGAHLHTSLPESLVEELSSLSGAAAPLPGPAQAPARRLVEEVEASDTAGPPPLRFEVEADDRVVVQVPDGMKASDLDISVDFKKLYVNPTAFNSRTVVEMPFAIDEDSVRAKFEKKHRRLVVLLKPAT